MCRSPCAYLFFTWFEWVRRPDWVGKWERCSSCCELRMPLPSSSPKTSHYASPVKLETNSTGTASSPPPSSSKKERRHKKKHHHSSGKQRSETPLTWKEQLFQVAAIFLTAVVVYKLTLSGVRWLEETRRPFCDDLQDPVRGERLCPLWDFFLSSSCLNYIRSVRCQGLLCVLNLLRGLARFRVYVRWLHFDHRKSATDEDSEK